MAKYNGEDRKRFVEEFEKFQAEDDKRIVEVYEGGRWKWEGNKLGLFGATVTKMTQGLFRKLYPER
jgi:hypothetical protein